MRGQADTTENQIAVRAPPAPKRPGDRPLPMPPPAPAAQNTSIVTMCVDGTQPHCKTAEIEISSRNGYWMFEEIRNRVSMIQNRRSIIFGVWAAPAMAGHGPAMARPWPGKAMTRPWSGHGPAIGPAMAGHIAGPCGRAI